MPTLQAPSCAAARPRQAALVTQPRAYSSRGASRRQPGLLRAAAAAANGSSSSSAGSGGGVILLPGFLYTTRQYQGLAADLSSKGFDAGVQAGMGHWCHQQKGLDNGLRSTRRQLASRTPCRPEPSPTHVAGACSCCYLQPGCRPHWWIASTPCSPIMPLLLLPLGSSTPHSRCARGALRLVVHPSWG